MYGETGARNISEIGLVIRYAGLFGHYCGGTDSSRLTRRSSEDGYIAPAMITIGWLTYTRRLVACG